MVSSNNAITIFDKEYPKELLCLEQPPLVLFYKGNLELLKKKNKIAVVGSRKPDDYASRATKEVVKRIGENNVIISGGALGIDTIAHENAKETIMVLGCGIDNVYPKENLHLFAQVEKTGLILSEYPGDTAPEKENFLARNRIVAALANEIYVMSITKESGTMNTVNNAHKLGKPISVLPVSIFSDELYNNTLIEKGATILKLKDV